MTSHGTGEPPAARAQRARLALELNRQELRAAFAPGAAGASGSEFPRSATFRWLSRHIRPRALLVSAASAALGRVPLGRLLGSVLLRRRG